MQQPVNQPVDSARKNFQKSSRIRRLRDRARPRPSAKFPHRILDPITRCRQKSVLNLNSRLSRLTPIPMMMTRTQITLGTSRSSPPISTRIGWCEFLSFAGDTKFSCWSGGTAFHARLERIARNSTTGCCFRRPRTQWILQCLKNSRPTWKLPSSPPTASNYVRSFLSVTLRSI
jgi:hypothetical protein